MPRGKSEQVYTEEIHLWVTKPMLADLKNVAAKSGQPMSAVIRQAVRNYLDDTDLTLGTRRNFDRRFQKRLDALEHQVEQYLLTLLVMCASQFAAQRQLKGGDLLKESARLAAGDTGSQMRQVVLKKEDTRDTE